MSNEGEHAYVGWTRIGRGKWVKVASATTEAACNKRLNEHVADVTVISIDLYVGRKDIDPNDEPRPR